MSKITLRLIAKIDARDFLKVENLPALKNAVIGISYDIDLGDGGIASCDSEEGLLEFMRGIRQNQTPSGGTTAPDASSPCGERVGILSSSSQADGSGGKDA